MAPAADQLSSIAKLAYELNEFLSLPEELAGITAEASTSRKISWIITNLPRHEPVRSALQGRSTRGRSVEAPPYPIEWTTRPAAAQHALEDFEHQFDEFTRLVAAKKASGVSDKTGEPSKDVPNSPKPAELPPPLPAPKPRTPIQKPNLRRSPPIRRTSPVSRPQTPGFWPEENDGSPHHTPTRHDRGNSRQEPTMSNTTIGRDDLQAIVAAAVTAALQHLQPAVGPATTTAGPAFKARDIGLFDPNTELDAVESKDGTQVFHNVWAFTNRVRVKASTPETSRLIRENLDTCLIGKAERWHTEELNNIYRSGLRNDPQGIELWCKALEDRFRESPGTSLSRLESLRYTVRDARAKRDPEEFVQQIIINGKASGLATTDAQQVLLAYEHFDATFRRDLPVVNERSTISDFLKHVTVQKNIWFELYPPRALSDTDRTNPRYTNNNNRNRGGRSDFLRTPLQSASSPRYQGKPPGNRDSYEKISYEKGSQEHPNNNAQGQKGIKQEFTKDRPAVAKDTPRGQGQNYRDKRPRNPRNYHAAEDTDDSQDDQEAYQVDEDNPDQSGDSQADPSENQEESVEAHFGAEISTKSYPCKKCKTRFQSKNRLHEHIRLGVCTAIPVKKKQPSPPATTLPTRIVKSTVEGSSSVPGYSFRGWRYATAKAAIGKSDSPLADICLDTGCTATLSDKRFFREKHPNTKIHVMPAPLEVSGIGQTKHSAREYAMMDFYLPGKDGRVANFRREVHLVDNLKANLLVGVDIMVPEGIAIDPSKGIATIRSCDGIEIDISVRTRSKEVRKPVFTKEQTHVPAHTRKAIPIGGARGKTLDLPKDRDLLFEPDLAQDVSVFAHIVDYTAKVIYVQNDSNTEVVLPRNMRMGNVIEYDAAGCFLADPATMDMAARPPKKTTRTGWTRYIWKAALTAAAAAGIAACECKLPNGATAYGTPNTVSQLQNAVESYPNLWIDHGNTARLPESQWMEIPLLDNWQELYKPGQARVYALGQQDRQVIDAAFDKLHSQGRMAWTSEPTPFTFPCFVIWKNLGDGKRKGRVVVDIRALNKITMPDAYPMPLQSDILSAVSGASYITTIDCCSFFYHWLVRKDHRHRLTVSSHRGQETFKVAVMGYRNSPAYVQRMIDNILRPFRGFARAYVDDIVIFSNSLDDHLKHLHLVFEKLSGYNICLSPEKSFIGYPSVALLGQRVDAFGLATAEEKLAAITKLAFPQTLRQLEHYLGLTGYLRQYIPYYSAVAQPLQARKTMLNAHLRSENKVGGARKRAASKLGISTATPKELEAFNHLQGLFSRPSMLVHFSPKSQLYIDIDASQEVGIGAYAYHVTSAPDGNGKSAGLPKQKTIQPILFLSRELTGPEAKYWPTELEICGLVWVVRKLRHMIETAELPVIVYTDHSATCQIAEQTSLNTVSIEKSNLKLVRSSEYLQRFRLDIRHRPGITNVIPDALSRLPIVDSCRTRLIERDELSKETPRSEMVSAHPVTLVELSDEFKTRLIQGYSDDPRWTRIRDMVTANADLRENAAVIPYKMLQQLIYFDDVELGLRLCIPEPLVQEVFRLAHDEVGHQGYDRTHQRLSEGLYIYNMAKHLRVYITHCPECQLRRTPRHPAHGSLQPILSPPRPFHTISIDFILALPATEEGFDCAMSVTCKFSKAITLIPGKIAMSGKEWAGTFLDRLSLLLWGLPRAILSDRDPRFIGQLWRGIFERLNVHLLYSTSYHPQTDGMSERTNQTVEIALRYYLAALQEGTLNKWPTVLPRLSHALCNSTNFSSTGKTPTQVLFGFRTREALDFLRVEQGEPVELPQDGDLPQEEADTINANPVRARPNGRRESQELVEEPRQDLQLANIDDYRPCHIDAKDAIAFASMRMKNYYDLNHKLMFFKVGDLVNLRLHRGFTIPGILHKKINQQFVGPFKVLQRVGKLAYKLELPPNMRIHPVISVAHLEPATVPADDPWLRRRPTPPPVMVDGQEEWVIEKLLERRRIRRGRGFATQYLVRWMGFGPEHDTWYNLRDLDNARELVDDFDNRQPADLAAL